MNNWDEWIGVKYGTLTVKDLLIRKIPSANIRYFVLRCKCGRERTVRVHDFVQGKVKSCGKPECKSKVVGLTLLPQAPLSAKSAHTLSAIEARLKPKYFCKAVAPECTISTLLHICCCECDRPCKRCSNTPQKCGARERKNTANHSS